jgi:hypothetical protein
VRRVDRQIDLPERRFDAYENFTGPEILRARRRREGEGTGEEQDVSMHDRGRVPQLAGGVKAHDRSVAAATIPSA